MNTWPDTLWIVRHGQSAGNVARDAADEAGLVTIDIAERDMDVPLSDLGMRQSTALANWFASLPPNRRPTAILASPYLRATATAQQVANAWHVEGAPVNVLADERLREKEFGVLDRLTHFGIVEKFPELAEARTRTGKFYYRPPGGESWCDVILRLRSVLDTISLHYSQPGSRVLIVAHQVIVLCLRYLLEEMTEQKILGVDREGDVANCGITEYEKVTEKNATGEQARLRLVRYNYLAPLENTGTQVTASADVPAAPR